MRFFFENAGLPLLELIISSGSSKQVPLKLIAFLIEPAVAVDCHLCELRHKLLIAVVTSRAGLGFSGLLH